MLPECRDCSVSAAASLMSVVTRGSCESALVTFSNYVHL